MTDTLNNTYTLNDVTSVEEATNIVAYARYQEEVSAVYDADANTLIITGEISEFEVDFIALIASDSNDLSAYIQTAQDTGADANWVEGVWETYNPQGRAAKNRYHKMMDEGYKCLTIIGEDN